MRFENDGLVLSYGTSEAEAPSGTINAAADRTTVVTINAAVQPINSADAVEIRFRINTGQPNSVNAIAARQDTASNTQFFQAKLPVLRAGERIDYAVLVRSNLLQVPSISQALEFPASFLVVAATAPKNAAIPSPDSGMAATFTLCLDKTQMLSLAKQQSATLPELLTRDAELGTTIANLIAVARKTIAVKALKGISPELSADLEKIDYSPALPACATIESAILSGLEAQKASSQAVREASERLTKLQRSKGIVDPFALTVALSDQALFQPALKQAALYELGDAVPLSDAAVQHIFTLANSPTLIDDTMLVSLVADHTLTAAEALGLGLLLSLYFLTSDRASLAVAIKPKVAAIQDVARLSVEDWTQAIASSGALLPAGLNTADYAAALRRACTNLYPTDTLHALAPPVDSNALRQWLTAVQPLIAKNPAMFGAGFDALNVSDVKTSDLDAVSTAYENVQSLINQYPGLELESLFNGSGALDAKVGTVQQRLDLLTKLRALNPQSELLGLDYNLGSADRQSLKTDGLTAGDAELAVAHYKSAQRVHAITGEVDHTRTIMSAGYASASAVGMDGPDTLQEKTGLSKVDADLYYEKAAATLTKSSHALISAVDAYDGVFQRTRVGNTREEIKEHLKAIPGFSDLFGKQDYCNCAECQSILGAAAYFVDLMTFVEENLTGKVFRGKNSTHPLNLKTRRPDLWTLPLTCANTNDRVSYLDIINSTLEDYIAGRDLGPRTDISGSERPQATLQIYENSLSKAQGSFCQPFSLPGVKLDVYLEHFGTSRVQVARALGADSQTLVKAALHIPDLVYQQLLSSQPDPAFLATVLGMKMTFTGSTGDAGPLNVVDLLRATGFTRAELEQAVLGSFVTRCGAYTIVVQAEKSSPESIQNDIERIRGMTGDALHRLYRFTKLLRHTPWSVANLDLILLQLGAAQSATGLDAATLTSLVGLLDLRRRWSLPVDQSCALWGPLPSAPVTNSLFDRTFNFAPLVVAGFKLPAAGTKFVHAAFSSSGSACLINGPANLGTGSPQKASDLNMSQRIAAALQITDGELIVLISSLAPALGVNLAGKSDADFGFSLTLQNLSLLYRHALLARLLGLGFASLFQLIELALHPGSSVGSMDDLRELLEFTDLATVERIFGRRPCVCQRGDGVESFGISARFGGCCTGPAAGHGGWGIAVCRSDLRRTARHLPGGVTGDVGGQSPAVPACSQRAPSSLRSCTGLHAGRRIAIPRHNPLVLAWRLASAISADHPGQPDTFHPIANSTPPLWQLNSTFGPTTTLIVPPPISLAPADGIAALAKYAGGPAGAAAALLPHHASEVVPALLSSLLGVDTAIASMELSMSGANLSDAKLIQALQDTSGSAASLELLTNLVQNILPLNVLLKTPGYTADDVAFIQKNGPLFGIGNFKSISVAAIRKLSVYGRLSGGTQGPAPVRDALTGFTAAQLFSAVNPAELSAVLGIDVKRLGTLLPQFQLPATAPEALDRLSQAVGIADQIGVGGTILKDMLSDDYSDQTAAADAVLSAFRAQYTSDADFQKVSQSFDDRIRGAKRDALTDYLLNWGGYHFPTQDDLYNYFLLDTRLEGCMQSSWVVAAVSSVQLYVYRCLMNLEEDSGDPNAPGHIKVSPSRDVTEQWEWRQNYRVWQANREIFLFPESYILPELRDDKTPLFEELESALGQQPITEQNVLDAYSSYLSGFDQLSKLKIAGNFHDIDSRSRTDTLHLFGVSSEDPPTFFYRTIDNAQHGETETDRSVTYTPWVPVNLQIQSRAISPVVCDGRLFVFWTQVSTAPQNLLVDTNSIFNGYKHTWRVKYSSLRLDQTWTAPQQLALTDGRVFPDGDSIVLDPLLDTFDKGIFRYDAHTTGLLTALASNNPSPEQKADIDDFVVLQKAHGNPKFSAGDLTLSLYQAGLTPQYVFGFQPQLAAVDGYTLSGYEWDRVYPTLSANGRGVLLTGRNFALRNQGVDFYNQSVSGSLPEESGRGRAILFSRFGDRGIGGNRDLFSATLDAFPLVGRYAWAAILSREEQMGHLSENRETADLWTEDDRISRRLTLNRIASIPPDTLIEPVNVSTDQTGADAILDIEGDLLLLQGASRPGQYLLKRLSTRLGPSLSRRLFSSGVDGLLSLGFQEGLGEDRPRLDDLKGIDDQVTAGRVDFTGAMGTYFREIFFHAPYLIAHQLNSQQNFEAAEKWYRYIFNPTAEDSGTPKASGIAARDRVWRYNEFRSVDVPTLRETLTNAAAVQAYEQDPFNPHAIARLRLSAYQKSIVIAYVNNLTAWGDALFTEFQMETVNEASLLYSQALDVLGPPPAIVGDCGQIDEGERTYEHIAGLIKRGSPFLVEMESYTHAASGVARSQPKQVPAPHYVISRETASHAIEEGLSTARRRAAGASQPSPVGVAASVTAGPSAVDNSHGTVPVSRESRETVARPYNWKGTHRSARSPSGGTRHPVPVRRKGKSPASGTHSAGIAWSVARHVVPAFCIPPNNRLLDCWETIEDRLHKIRNGLDINGIPRQLSLFAPALDPAMLVEEAAGGLGLDQVSNASGGDAPPYRFSFLIDKAKQFTSQLQSFGGALLAAIEKRDAQKLEVLRVTQQQNLLSMTTSIKQAEVDSAQSGIDSLNAQQTTAQTRHDYFQGLLDTGLTASELLETAMRTETAAYHLTTSTLFTLSGVTHLIPQLGSPFSLKYGGKEVGDSIGKLAAAGDGLAAISETLAGAAALFSGHQRRSQGWQHEVDMATKDLAQIATQLVGANSRLSIAKKTLDVHKKTIAQQQQVADFYTSRFTNVALYSWLATTLQSTYRQAYNSAFAMSMLAQTAYQFERNDGATSFLSTTYWSQEHGGLMAAEQLHGDLQRMEHRFLETNYRTPEITQSFSMAQIAPVALLNLRQSAGCTFDIPELCFDLHYPGYYRRKIRSVRLTIPCVAGPLTNIGATLTLTNSQLRMEAASVSLTPLQLRHSVMIATSTAQNDAGMFEFSFRDERYLPFEGAGAVSSWKVELPDGFRTFDYQTITDVILHVSYTAQYDVALRQSVQQKNGSIAQALQRGSFGRLLSFRQEFPSVLHRLLHGATGMGITLSLAPTLLPFYVASSTIQVSKASLLLRTVSPSITAQGFIVTLDGTPVSAFQPDPALGDLLSADVTAVFSANLFGDHKLTLTSAGSLAPPAGAPGAGPPVDDTKLLDVFLYVEYHTGSTNNP